MKTEEMVAKLRTLEAQLEVLRAALIATGLEPALIVLRAAETSTEETANA